MKELNDILKAAYFFEVENIIEVEYDDHIANENQPIMLNVQNWDLHKEQFIKERFGGYSDLGKDEVIMFELRHLEDVECILDADPDIMNSDTIRTLIGRYKSMLKKPQKKNELSLSQLALKLVYQGIQMNRNSAGDIAAKYGFQGDSLYNKFLEYSNRTDRKAQPYPYTKVTLRNKIKLFESVIEMLPKEKSTQAIDELNILLNFFKTDFS